jgi:hypothetical protein
MCFEKRATSDNPIGEESWEGITSNHSICATEPLPGLHQRKGKEQFHPTAEKHTYPHFIHISSREANIHSFLYAKKSASALLPFNNYSVVSNFTRF